MNGVFYLSAVVALLSTAMVITRGNAVHALLYFIVSLLSVAMIFFVLGAPFVAALEVIIYAGAIMVLFVFAIMLLNIGTKAAEQERQLMSAQAWAGPAALTVLLLGEFLYVMAAGPGGGPLRVVGPKEVGVTLLTRYVLGVELASILLLAGLVGAYHLGRRERGTEGEKKGT